MTFNPIPVESELSYVYICMEFLDITLRSRFEYSTYQFDMCWDIPISSWKMHPLNKTLEIDVSAWWLICLHFRLSREKKYTGVKSDVRKYFFFAKILHSIFWFLHFPILCRINNDHFSTDSFYFRVEMATRSCFSTTPAVTPV